MNAQQVLPCAYHKPVQMQPVEMKESIADAQARLADDFHLLDEPTDRYEHLITLGRSLEPMAEDLKVDGNHLKDCRGEAWLAAGYGNGNLYLSGASHSDIIAGLLQIVIEVYNGHAISDVLDHPLDIEKLGLTSCLSPHRLSCLQGIHQRVRNLAMLARVQGCA